MLEARRQQIASGLANAEKIKAELARIEAERQEHAGEGGRRGQAADRGSARRRRVRAGEETQKAIAAAEQIIAQGARSRRPRPRAMLAELKREVGRLVVQTTATVTGKILTPEDHRRLAEGDGQAACVVGGGTSRRSKRGARTRQPRKLFRLCLVERRARREPRPAGGDGTLPRRAPGRSPCSRTFQRLVRLDRDRHTASSSAAPLTDDLRDGGQSRPARTAMARRLATPFAENPELIGGMRIKVGSDVYDGSVRAGWPRSRRACESRR